MQKSSKMSGVGVGDAAPSTAVSSGSYSATTTAKAVTSSARRILSKSWRSKQQGKSAPCSPAANSGNKSFWIPVASNTWCNNAAGSRVVLTATSLLHLTDVEHAATQKAALARLQALDLGTKINIPKEWTSQKSKRSRFLLKRRVVGSSNALDSLSDSYVSNCKDSSAKGGSSSSSGEGASSSHGCSSGWVFGLPLAKCIANDSYLRRDEMPENGDRRVLTDGSPDRPPLTPLPTPRPVVRNRKSSSSSGGAISCDDSESDCGGVVAVDGIGSCITNAKSTAGGNVGRRSSLPDALLLSPWTSRRKYVDSCEEDQLLMTSSAARTQLQVPYIVTTCFQHLQTYGLRVLGIFRIGSSKKRTIQLREEFDRGGKVILTEEHNPHDVAALLKEFFRDLSDPLLTRDLYSAFVATRKLKSQEKRLEAANLLVALLPTTNRDTLWALLSFLNLVRKHSTDSLDEHGNTLPGNKMDSHNLATLFGPNILHKAKGGALQYQVESQERAEERVEVIEVVREMIDHQSEIFALSAELHDEALRILIRTSPEAVDQLLTSRTSSSLGVNNIDADHESTGSGIELDVGCLPGGLDQSAVSCSSPGSESESTSPSSPYRPGTLIETLQPPPAGPLSGRTIFEVLQAHAASVSAAARSAQAGGCPSALTGAVLGGVDMSLTAVALGCMTSSPSFASTSASAVLSSPSQQRRAQQPEMRICITTDSPEQSRRTQKSAAASSTSEAAAAASASAPTTSSAVPATTTKTTSVTTTASTGPTSAATAAESTGSPRASHIGRRSSGVPHGSVRAFEKQLLKQQQSPSTTHHSKSLHHHHHHLQQQPLQHTLTVPTSRYSRSRELDSGSSSAGSTGYSSRGSSISPSPSPEPNSPLVPAAGSTPTAATASIPNTLHLYQRTSPCPPQRAAGHQTNAAAASLGSPPSSRSLSTQRPLGILRPPPISISGPTSPTSSSGTASDAAAGGGSSTRGCSMRWDLVTGHRHQSSRPEDLKEQETLV